ncbi:hypothetical protein TKK_0017750 [Trichogramma kaykai]
MADDDPRQLKEDGSLSVDAPCRQIVYHPSLNVLLITTASNQLVVFDVSSGLILQQTESAGNYNGKFKGVHLGGVDKILYTDGKSIGVRGDYNGVLLLDTLLQTPLSKGEDIVKLEMLRSEALILYHHLLQSKLVTIDHVTEVLNELNKKITAEKAARNKVIKAQKWSTICVELPHTALKLVCSTLVVDLKKQNKHIPVLPIASAINERLNSLLPSSLPLDPGTNGKVLMYSEAARRDTFFKWPHMNYKWALPDQMAQAGFYHQPNTTGEDRAMCFTCSVCLVCWEPTDEPWSEHERHSPSCPFVKGEYTQNVPLSVTLATAPAVFVNENVDVIGSTNIKTLIATSSQGGFINVWNVQNNLKKETHFYLTACSVSSSNNGWYDFSATKTLPSLSSGFLPNPHDTEALSDDYKPSTSTCLNPKTQLTALALVNGLKSTTNDKGKSQDQNESSTLADSFKSKPCLVSGVSVSSRCVPSINVVWSSTSNIASSSSLVHAMNSANSAASEMNSLDIMKVATSEAASKDLSTTTHYLVVCDFDHKSNSLESVSKDSSKDSSGKSKKQISGTGTSASSNGVRQETLYQEIFFSKFLLDEINEETEMNTSDQLGMYPTVPLVPPVYYSNNTNPPSSSFDTNSNPIGSFVSEHVASTSAIEKAWRALDVKKSNNAKPIVIQTLRVEGHEALRINNILPTKDGKHLVVTMCPQEEESVDDLITNTFHMEVDEDGSPKNPMNWDSTENPEEPPEKPLPNGVFTHAGDEEIPNALIIIYALDFSGKVVRLAPEPILRRELPPSQSPKECVLIPISESDSSFGTSMLNAPSTEDVLRGQMAVVCRDGIIRLLDLASLKTITETNSEDQNQKFISAAYCSRLDKLCACTKDGALHFFNITNEDESSEDKDSVTSDMIVDANSDENELNTPSTSRSSNINSELMLANKQNLSHADLQMLYGLTRFDWHSPAYGANVPPCWSEMMQAQRQRRYPQHLHQQEDQHHTRTWRLQSDGTSWDDHLFELTLPRNAAGNVGHVDVRFTLHYPCHDLPNIQVTLYKQNVNSIVNKKKGLAVQVDEGIDINKYCTDPTSENPDTSEDVGKVANMEILSGPINLKNCMDLSDHSGCITLTSPKLFKTKAKTLIVHIKACNDSLKEGTSKSQTSFLESKPPTSKKLRIDETGPLPPGATIERVSSKKSENHIGCDWIHEISITVRTVHPTSIPNEKLQRCAMLESKRFIENLLNIACLETSDKSPVVQSLALDILVWVAAIRLTRYNTPSNTKVRTFQLEMIHCVEKSLPALLRSCILDAGRSIAHKCIKLIILCLEDVNNLEDMAPRTFEDSLLSVLESILPNIVSIKWAGSLRWFSVLLTKLLTFDRSHKVAHQCIKLIQDISSEMSKRVDPYHLLLATRFGLYNSPFETELFELDPPFSMKPNSLSTVCSNIYTFNGDSIPLSQISLQSTHLQDSIDLRDLLSLPLHSANDLVVPSKLKSLCNNHTMRGLLEVEPLHFTCHAASDGTKLEKVDAFVPTVSTINSGVLYDSAAPTTANATSDTKTIHHAYNFDAATLGPDLQAKLTTKLTDFLSQCVKNVHKPSTFESFSKKNHDYHTYSLEDQSDSDEINIHSQLGTTHIWSVYSDKPSQLSTVPKSVKSPLISNVVSTASTSATTSKLKDASAKKKEDINFPWGRLLCWPPQQALVVERMHSGARRFVILDFGAPVLLTDFMIPACNDLVSLSIDVWTKSEEADGVRLVVAGDIGTKPLAVNDLQPPPVCRYLKITTIGRYGMSTTRCKIPLGTFNGHMIVLPGEDYAEQVNVSKNYSELPLRNNIESQCTVLSALAEDVHCRFTLATERLKSYLDPLLCAETANVLHMQYYLSQGKHFETRQDGPSGKILTTYQECVMYQHQLNIIRSVWQRLENWRNPENSTSNTLANASTDKLRILGETLLDILLYTIYEIGPIPSVPATLYDAFTPSVCEQLFNSICVMTPAPHLQLYVVALLAKAAGHKDWWGQFLANTLVNLYSVSSIHIFPQDRVFILLTFLGRKSLITCNNKSLVIDAMVSTLGKLLTPLSSTQPNGSNRLDSSLIGWVLLFLSVCLDTTAIHSSPAEENQDKMKEQQGISSRWEFIQGEVAMQKKFVGSGRNSASRNYRKKLQKRLMHHKQVLQDAEAKKYHPSSSQASLFMQTASLSSKLEAAIKNQEKMQKKQTKQHASTKHFKDIFGIRRHECNFNRVPKAASSSGASQSSEPMDSDGGDNSRNLSYQTILPVARDLVSLLLNNSSNVDMFLLTCKVIAKLVISTQPVITLGELMTQDQLFKLMKLATKTSDIAWLSHAVSCLLQDLLEGEKLYPRNVTTHESIIDQVFETIPVDDININIEESYMNERGSTGMLGSKFKNDESFHDEDEDTQDSIIITPNTSSTKINAFNLPSLLESDDSEFEEFLDNILERGKTILKKGGTSSKYSTITNFGSISQAIDARLEYGVETGVAIALRRLSTLGKYNLPIGINATINPPKYTYNSGTYGTRNVTDSPPSSLLMLTRCFDKIFCERHVQSSGNLETLLQLWLTLNLDASSDASNSSQYSMQPVIPLSANAISGLISAFSWHPGVSLRAWCYLLQTLTLASNQAMKSELNEAASCSASLDGLLGGMASVIVKEKNMGAMLLRLLSGNGLNIDSANKHFGMAGPTLCQALQEFLSRLAMRCDIVTPGSSLGNSMKELLLWVVYQLVQPGGALVARRGPLDAQCRLINSLLNMNFNNTDLGTAMSITECVGELVSNHVRGVRVGAQCGSTAEASSQLAGFGGLYTCVLGNDSKQSKPASWDALVVALLKLVCRLVQTPLAPNPTAQDAGTEMEVGDSYSTTSSQSDMPEKMNTSQTDESKAAEKQSSTRPPVSETPRVPCIADTVLQHEPTMMRLMGALAHCSKTAWSPLKVLSLSPNNATAETNNTPPTIIDATYQLLVLLVKKTSNPKLVLGPVYIYLASSTIQNVADGLGDMMGLSEPLLSFILRALDNEECLSHFTTMGGIRILCENLVMSSKNYVTNSSNAPGVIALVMQHLSNASNIHNVVTTNGGNKKSCTSLEPEEVLMNFAPLGTVTWLHPTAQAADVLIQSATPHRRARTAAWSYHFYPDESWIDLTITLPCAILLKEVELQPHLTSLATCPSAVALEISREGNTALAPICPPMPTAGLTFIRLTLSQPEVATAVLVRLYKPRDSTNISLSQIRLLGITAFGNSKTRDNVDVEKVSKSSIGWLRLIHQCLSLSSSNSQLLEKILKAASMVEGLIESFCDLLFLPAPSFYFPNLEKVLLQLGLHSGELGLKLINLMLSNRTAPLLQNTLYNKESCPVQMVVELLEQLCSAQDQNTKHRMAAVLDWLHTVAVTSVMRNAGTNLPGISNTVSPPAVYVHSISTIIWKTAKLENINYDLKELLAEDLFDALYQWTLTLKTHSALKQSIDAVLCAFCYVNPNFFQLLLQKIQIAVPNLTSGSRYSASISDDHKQSEGQTDDGKCVDLNDLYARLAQSEFKRLSLTEGQLLSIASAARSSPGVCQLINSGLPTLLTACIIEFTILERSQQTLQQKYHDEVDMAEADLGPSTSTANHTMNSSRSVTDSDKVRNVKLDKSVSELDMTDPESIAIVLEFLTLVCSESKMRDWLGSEGSAFWLPLLQLLCERQVDYPTASTASSSNLNLSYTKLESAIIKFLSKCCWYHEANQNLLAELLTQVIVQQKVPSGARGLHGISGFIRRLILQLLLEGEKILVSITSDIPMSLVPSSISSTPVMPPHPAFPIGHYHHLLYLSTQSTLSDIVVKLIDGRQTRDRLAACFSEIMDTLKKNKKTKDASNRSQARGQPPCTGPMRTNREEPAFPAKESNLNPATLISAHNLRLAPNVGPNVVLQPDLTIAQLLAFIKENGNSFAEPCLYLCIDQRNTSVNKEEQMKFNATIQWPSISSTLEVFSSKGGLAVLAQYLPLVYPDTSRPVTYFEKSPNQEAATEADWVKIEPISSEANESAYEEMDESRTETIPKPIVPTPQVPPHSLAAFGLFLRLPGYSEVLLRDRKRAQCLLRLALGVGDDGEGRDILSSPIASSLPTLPFHVLRRLFHDTPPTTDDGLLLRRSAVEVGAVLLLLNCLAVFTHQTSSIDGSEQRSSQTGGRSDDKSHLYWAKGTGFGTGSTQQSWNVEQALNRQRSEEEHVTVLLQVLASYIGSGEQPQRELPSAFTELLSRSCLLPALSSYLRNDSVLDMARHIPLYRAILHLLRAMANSSQLAMLLLPQTGRSTDPSILSLLTSMRQCVDNYVNKINRAKALGTSKGKSVPKFLEESDQDEGLALLIPDIQNSASIVQDATAKLVEASEDVAGPASSGPEMPLRSIEQRYLEVMKKLQFDAYEMIEESPDGGFKFVVSYHFETNMRSAGERHHPSRTKRLAQEAVTLSTALPLSYSSSVFVRCDTDRLDIMKVLITGPADTPYANGCFEFDVYFPPDYPNSPMMINLETTGRRTVRFNPNLYNDGKVCLSVLNTWHGRPEEKWNAQTSSFLQVLVSIQSLILVSEPYFNEPGYERSRGSTSGAHSSQEYNANVSQATVKWAMLEQIKNPCPCFKEVIHTHFWLKKHEICAQVEGWIREMENCTVDRRTGRTLSMTALALQRHYKHLREELNKLPTPEGLEDLAEPLRSPASPLDNTLTPGTPNSPPPSTMASHFINLTNPIQSTSASETTMTTTSNHVQNDIDTDVEMEKIVSKVCD